MTKITNNTVSGDHSKDREYQYDALGRLTVAKGGLNSALWTQSYTYDRYGNRTSVAATGVAADNTTMPTDGIPNLSYNTANNQITTSNANGQYEYDAAGNQTRALDKDGVTWLRFEYDAANRLVNIKKASDGSLIQTQQFAVGNERIALTDVAANQTTWYEGSTEYTENNNSGVLSWSKIYIYLGDSILSTITPDGSGGEYTEYNHPDRLGTRLITNQQTGSNYEQTTLPFGTALNAESSYQTNPKRFTLYERSSKTDLDYAQNRTYDSKLGRFTQVDPIGMGAASFEAPQSLNLYTYCGNDPINRVDPSGLFWGKLFKAIGNFFKKARKWILVAVVVAVVLIATHGFGIGFLNSLAGWLAHGGAGIAHFVEGGGLVLGTTGKVLLGIATIGSIADNFAQTQGSNRDPNYWWIRFEAIRDAFWVLRHDLKCAKFFGLVDKNGQFSQKKFDELRKKEKFYVDVESRQNMAHTNGNNVTFERGFFNDGWFKGSRAPYSIQNPRQGRAQTVLHEIGHSKGLLKHDNTGDAPEDPNSPANQNEKAIKDNCGKGLSQIPTSY